MDNIYTKLAAEIAEMKTESTGLRISGISFTSGGLDSFFSDRLLPADLPKIAYIRADDATLATMRAGMLDLLAMLRGLYDIYQHAHWTVAGDGFYGDHLMFQRLYENTQVEIDTLAEKTVGYLGFQALDASDMVTRTAAWVNKWNQLDCPFKRGIQAEEDFQKAAKVYYDSMNASGVMTLGFDDYIMATASSHETHQYLLQQKLAFKGSKEGKGAKSASDKKTRIRVSSLGDLTGFLRYSKDLLINKCDKDLWRLTKDADGHHVIEKLYDADVLDY